MKFDFWKKEARTPKGPIEWDTVIKPLKDAAEKLDEASRAAFAAAEVRDDTLKRDLELVGQLAFDLQMETEALRLRTKRERANSAPQ